jgi:hypothetical protein
LIFRNAAHVSGAPGVLAYDGSRSPKTTEATLDMRLGLKTFVAVLLAAALVVPAATAKPGGGHGNGGGNGGAHGKPSWAGGEGEGNGHGKPAWAGGGRGAAKKAEKAKAKADKAKRAKAEKAERERRGKPDLANLEELSAEDLEGLNPAWTCKVERALYGDGEGFADEYGTNDNKANAFGMCVSEEAHERDGVSSAAMEAFCETSEEEASADEDAAGEEQVGSEEQVESEEQAGSEEQVEAEPAEEDSEQGLCAGEEAESGAGDEGGEQGSEAGEEGSEGGEEGSDSESESGLVSLRFLF